jgi:predicted SAM-dependent methyltransferase
LEHALEHLNCEHSWRLLEEFYRILCNKGVARIVCPSIIVLESNMNDEYLAMSKRFGWSNGTIPSALKALACNFEHKTLWTQELLGKVLEIIGFTWIECSRYVSVHSELTDVEGHWQITGVKADITSFVIEATKP